MYEVYGKTLLQRILCMLLAGKIISVGQQCEYRLLRIIFPEGAGEWGDDIRWDGENQE